MSVAERVSQQGRALFKLMHLLGRFLSGEHKKQLLLVSFCAFVLSLCEMLIAASVVPYVHCLQAGDQCVFKPIQQVEILQSVPLTLLFSLLLLGLLLLKLCMQAFFTWYSAAFTQHVQRDTVTRLLDGYLHLDWNSFKSQHIVHYVRRCTTTTVDAAYVSQQAVIMISALIMLLSMTLLMLWQYPSASVFLIVMFTLLNWITQRVISQRQRAIAVQRERAMQRWNVGMAEAFASFREVRVYGREQFFLGFIQQSLDALCNANQRLALLPMFPRLILEFAMFGLVLLLVSVWTWLHKPLAELLPHLIFYTVVARAALPAMMNLLSTRAVLFGASINLELVLEELHWAAGLRKPAITVASYAPAEQRIVLDAISYRHAEHLPDVLCEVSVAVQHPAWVALVGPSGAGKSTLLELVCGISQPRAGTVRYLWGQTQKPRIAYVPQQVALLHASIRDNIFFGTPADDVLLQQCLQVVCLNERIARLAEGVHTVVGPDGNTLSGGERQRLALARALYTQPEILLLDEATSGVDEATEVRVLEHLKRTFPQMTVFFITHRSSNLSFADQIISFEGGVVQAFRRESTT